MRVLLLTITLLTINACNDGRAPASPSIEIDGELLIGKYADEGKVAAFLGVPFAEPPVGDLRWRAPQALRTKLERRDATGFAPACMQTMRILDWYRSMAETFGGSADYYDDLKISEDCLYLNIWTPTLEVDAKLPIMVWVHGGSNKSGWSYELNYEGHELVRKDVVIISIAYRHGVFGFLSHPDLDTNEPAANFGLWDIVASLQWIQDNVAQFGGDPARVTMFGESAGAENILALMFSKQTNGLFHRAILHSTASYGFGDVPTLATEQQRGAKLADALYFEGDDALDQLRRVPADQLVAVYDRISANYYHAPAVDGSLINQPTWASIKSGDMSGRQLVIGSNADETLDRQKTAEDFLCPSQVTAASVSAASGDAWMYYFTRAREDKGGEKLGAYHGAEIPYAFGVHDAYMRTTEIDRALTDTMMAYWTQFAANGDPNSEQTPDWPQFAAPDFQVQELGDEVVTIPAPAPELCALFEASNASRN